MKTENKRLYQEMEEKFVKEVEMPELERRKIELGKQIKAKYIIKTYIFFIGFTSN